jgi:hypothetical protein
MQKRPALATRRWGMVAEHDWNTALFGGTRHTKRNATSECMEMDNIGLFRIENVNESVGANRIALAVKVPKILYLLSHRKPTDLQSIVHVLPFLDSRRGHHDIEALTLLLSREALDVHFGAACGIGPIAERQVNDFHPPVGVIRHSLGRHIHA